MNKDRNNQWQIIFCKLCGEPTPPANGLNVYELGFTCDDCLLTELEGTIAPSTTINENQWPPLRHD